MGSGREKGSRGVSAEISEARDSKWTQQIKGVNMEAGRVGIRAEVEGARESLLGLGSRGVKLKI